MGITRTIAKKISYYDHNNSLTYRLRAKRIRPLLLMIKDIYEKHSFVDIIDVGGYREYWEIVSSDYLTVHNVRITIVNLEGELGRGSDNVFSFAAGNGCDLSMFRDKQFHIAHSNSVIEHVGSGDNRIRFASEIRRVADKYFVQTPDFRFPLEPHSYTPFFHWLPRSVQIYLLQHFSLGHWQKASSESETQAILEYNQLLRYKEFSALFPDARIITERFLGLPKSLIALK